MRTAKTWLSIFVMAGLIGIVGCSNSSNPYSSSSTNNTGGNPTPSPNTIAIYNMAFGPSTLTIAKGTTIAWQNSDSVPHTATSDSGAWDSGNIAPGGTKSVTFNSTGTFPYHCTVHPMMTATIIVQ